MAVGAQGCPERSRGAMALQPPPLALRAGSAPALYIHSMPAWVLEDFCQKMDCLSDYDWMRFGEGHGAGGWRRGTGTAALPGRGHRDSSAPGPVAAPVAAPGAQGQQRLWDGLQWKDARLALSPRCPALGRAQL